MSQRFLARLHRPNDGSTPGSGRRKKLQRRSSAGFGTLLLHLGDDGSATQATRVSSGRIFRNVINWFLNIALHGF
jgi:hypothetical protein